MRGLDYRAGAAGTGLLAWCLASRAWTFDPIPCPGNCTGPDMGPLSFIGWILGFPFAVMVVAGPVVGVLSLLRSFFPGSSRSVGEAFGFLMMSAVFTGGFLLIRHYTSFSFIGAVWAEMGVLFAVGAVAWVIGAVTGKIP